MRRSGYPAGVTKLSGPPTLTKWKWLPTVIVLPSGDKIEGLVNVSRPAYVWFNDGGAWRKAHAPRFVSPCGTFYDLSEGDRDEDS